MSLTVSDVSSTPDALTFIYNSTSGMLSLDTGGHLVTVLGFESAAGWFNTDNVITPHFCHGLFDVCQSHKIFNIYPEGFGNIVIGPVLPPDLVAEQIVADMSVEGAFKNGGIIDELVPTSPHLFIDNRLGLFRWDNGAILPDSVGTVLGPGMQLEDRQLPFVLLVDADISRSTFANSVLTQARLTGSNLTSVDFTGTRIDGANFDSAQGFTVEQLYSTWNYEAKQLSGLGLSWLDLGGVNLQHQSLRDSTFFATSLTSADLSHSDLRNARMDQSRLNDANLSNADLTGASLYSATLTNANLSGARLSRAWFTLANLDRANLSNADLAGADFWETRLRSAEFTGANIKDTSFTRAIGFLPEQLYSTISYQQQDLGAISFSGLNLQGWDFGGQNLHGADFRDANLTDVNFGEAIIDGVAFSRTLTSEQLYSTASYQAKKLQGVVFESANLSSWDFRDQDLSHAAFFRTTLSDVNLDNANIDGVYFENVRGLEPEQLYSTANYTRNGLQNNSFVSMDLAGWDFSGLGLTQVYFPETNLAGADFSGANLANVVFFASNLRTADFSDTRYSGFFGAESVYDQWTLFPPGLDLAAQELRFVVTSVGDVNADDRFDHADINLLSEFLHGRDVPGNGLRFDLDENGVIDLDDHRFWVQEVKHTWFGDADLDGEFNSDDLMTVFQAGQYEDAIDGNSTWQSGDWNADGDFTSADLVVAFQDGGYDAGTRAATFAVPEASGAWSFGVINLLILLVASRKTGSRRFSHCRHDFGDKKKRRSDEQC
ncbi:MAG: pentapeptide repeat-containing protein [Planctomycetales bacterium]|nr:pentapeptide repeat-containing protein [Planctomycetales bacterium]